MNFIQILLVMLGGAIGSGLRYYVSRLCLISFPTVHFPFGTLAVNVIGAFVIGLLSVLFLTRWPSHAEPLRLFYMVGILGGFTTFSSFSLETVSLIFEDYAPRALLYVFLSLALCLLATWAGIILGKLIHA